MDRRIYRYNTRNKFDFADGWGGIGEWSPTGVLFLEKEGEGAHPKQKCIFAVFFFLPSCFCRLAVRLIGFIINVWFESEHEHLRVSIINVYIYIYIPHRPSCHALR